MPITVTPPPPERDDSPNSSNARREAFPLGWTRVQRKRKVTAEEACCDDPASCTRSIRPRVELQHSNSRADPSLTINGNVVFCLHDSNPSWLQGYFIPKGSNKPWGLLAVQEEIDDCLECADGGYRRLSLTVFHKQRRQKSSKIQHVDWTGGDMMRLSHSDLKMEADKLWTGTSALPYVKKYFKSLVEKLGGECCDEVDQKNNILEWMPHIAVITGYMSLVLPKEGNNIDFDSF